MRITPFRQAHAVPENGFQNRRQRTGFRTKTHTRTGMGEPSYGAYHAALDALGRAEFFTRVMRMPLTFSRQPPSPPGKLPATHGKRTAGDFQVRQAVALCVTRAILNTRAPKSAPHCGAGR